MEKDRSLNLESPIDHDNRFQKAWKKTVGHHSSHIVLILISTCLIDYLPKSCANHEIGNKGLNYSKLVENGISSKVGIASLIKLLELCAERSFCLLLDSIKL